MSVGGNKNTIVIRFKDSVMISNKETIDYCKDIKKKIKADPTLKSINYSYSFDNFNILMNVAKNPPTNDCDYFFGSDYYNSTMRNSTGITNDNYKEIYHLAQKVGIRPSNGEKGYIKKFIIHHCVTTFDITPELIDFLFDEIPQHLKEEMLRELFIRYRDCDYSIVTNNPNKNMKEFLNGMAQFLIEDGLYGKDDNFMFDKIISVAKNNGKLHKQIMNKFQIAMALGRGRGHGLGKSKGAVDGSSYDSSYSS